MTDTPQSKCNGSYSTITNVAFRQPQAFQVPYSSLELSSDIDTVIESIDTVALVMKRL